MKPLLGDDTKPGQPAVELREAEMRTHQRRLVRVAVAVVGWGRVLVAPTGASAAIVTIDSYGAWRGDRFQPP